jgi:hypothetical protein
MYFENEPEDAAADNKIYRNQGILMTLDRPTITREELYEAVWAESMVKVAKIYGLSDVGVAKIAKKLHVPVPGRGYWAKGPMER